MVAWCGLCTWIKPLLKWLDSNFFQLSHSVRTRSLLLSCPQCTFYTLSPYLSFGQSFCLCVFSVPFSSYLFVVHLHCSSGNCGIFFYMRVHMIGPHKDKSLCLVSCHFIVMPLVILSPCLPLVILHPCSFFGLSNTISRPICGVLQCYG